VPASFGLPWQDNNLTLSFAPDGTSTTGTTSDLFDSLNQVRSPEEWQREILRAYQQWVQVSNVNIAVVGDSGHALGTPGRWQGDDRFGDIRVAGASLGSSVLAIGTPADPGLAGTRAGDVVLNTDFRFDGSPYDLYSVMLHESGHTLGLGNSTSSSSVMFTQFNGVRTGLSGADVTAIRTLYGARQHDQFERGNNNSTARAFDLGGPPAGQPDTVLLNYADLTTAADLDVYSFITPGRGSDDDHKVTVKIQSAGLSLVNAKLVVFYLEDGQEKEVANATMNPDGFTGGEASVSFDPNDDFGPLRYFVRVQHADGTEFQVGQYALAVSFRDGGDDDFSQVDLNTLLTGPRPVLLNADGNSNNTLNRATQLTPTSISTTLPNSRYEVQGSLTTRNDADFYRVIAPRGSGPRVLTVNALNLDGQSDTAPVQLLDANGVAVHSTVLMNTAGVVTIQASGLTAGATYFVRVGGGTTSMAGNYHLTADFSTQVTAMTTFATGQIPSGTTSVVDTLYVAQSQVMHFLLSASTATPAPVGTGVRMVIRNEAGLVVFDLYAPAGQTVSAPGVLLRPGAYSVTIEAVRTGGYTGPLQVSMTGNRSSDPIGVVPTNPTFRPTYQHPTQPGTFLYPGNFVSISPFFWLTLLRP
jgi:hypothetical protein